MQKLNRSLLFTELNTNYSSGADTPLDLKLDMLLPEGTESLFRVKPTEKGLLLRREFFSRILADRGSAVERFNIALSLLTEAEESYRAFESAVCDNAKYYVFTEYARRMVDIYREFAKMTDYGELYEGFSSYFADVVDSEEFNGLTLKLEKIAESKKRIDALDLNADGDKLKVAREFPDSMCGKIAHCLEAYGIAAPQPKVLNFTSTIRSPRRISKRL